MIYLLFNIFFFDIISYIYIVEIYVAEFFKLILSYMI